MQALPQVPQFAASVCRFVQVFEQSVWPLAQAQAPLTQVCPLPQALPQVPQLAESVWRFLQVPEQLV